VIWILAAAAGFLTRVLYVGFKPADGDAWHCWLRFHRHSWAWRPGLHRICEYRYCTECGWPGGMRVLDGVKR
jgi:hypothetical protein